MTGVINTQSTVAKSPLDVQQAFTDADEKVQSGLAATQDAAYDATEKLAQSVKQQEVQRTPTAQLEEFTFGLRVGAIKAQIWDLEQQGTPEAETLAMLRELYL